MRTGPFRWALVWAALSANCWYLAITAGLGMKISECKEHRDGPMRTAAAYNTPLQCNTPASVGIPQGNRIKNMSVFHTLDSWHNAGG